MAYLLLDVVTSFGLREVVSFRSKLNITDLTRILTRVSSLGALGSFSFDFSGKIRVVWQLNQRHQDKKSFFLGWAEAVGCGRGHDREVRGAGKVKIVT